MSEEDKSQAPVILGEDGQPLSKKAMKKSAKRAGETEAEGGKSSSIASGEGGT